PSQRTMHTGGLLLCLAAVACVSQPCLTSRSGAAPLPPQRYTLLALLRAATAIHRHPQQYPQLYRRGNAGMPHTHFQAPHEPAVDLQEEEEARRAWDKRGAQEGSDTQVNVQEPQQEPQEGQQEAAVTAGLQQVGASIASNFLRHARSGPRPYDVPRI
ncbi:hypothetical protein OTU49_011664, partial [Cherax quadricarinatus]